MEPVLLLLWQNLRLSVSASIYLAPDITIDFTEKEINAGEEKNKDKK